MFRFHMFLVLALIAGAADAASFHVLVAETPPFNAPPSEWGAIVRYDFTDTGSAATPGLGISESLLSDPAGLAISHTGELFVGNRHGNTAESSVSRFTFDGTSYGPNGVITGNSLFGSHGLNVSLDNELFVTNVNGPISRFIEAGNDFVAHGTISVGSTREVVVSPDQQWLYATEGVTNNLLKFDVATGSLQSVYGVPGASVANSDPAG